MRSRSASHFRRPAARRSTPSTPRSVNSQADSDRASMIREAWHVFAVLVFLAALFVGVLVVSGRLEPLGFAYYGVIVEWRTETLFMLLAVLQLLAIVDAVVLARRHRTWTWWAALFAVALFHPVSIVIAMGQLDAWRYEQKTPVARIVAFAVM